MFHHHPFLGKVLRIKIPEARRNGVYVQARQQTPQESVPGISHVQLYGAFLSVNVQRGSRSRDSLHRHLMDGIFVGAFSEVSLAVFSGTSCHALTWT